MKLTIIRIEENVVTCELEGGGLIEIACRWFNEDIAEGDIIDIDVTKVNKS